jgi:hypothetical protein
LLKEAFEHKKRRASLEIYNTIVKIETKVAKRMLSKRDSLFLSRKQGDEQLLNSHSF